MESEWNKLCYLSRGRWKTKFHAHVHFIFFSGDRTGAFTAIAELVIEPYTSDNKNTHAVEHSGSNFLFKQLIIRDKTGSPADGGKCLRI